MLAQKRQLIREDVAPRVARRRRRANMLRGLFHNRMACITLLAVTLCFALTIYVSAYARVTKEGYRKADLLANLRALKLQNQELRVQRDALRQPDLIAKFAEANGMKPSLEMAYLRQPTEVPRLAANTSED